MPIRRSSPTWRRLPATPPGAELFAQKALSDDVFGVANFDSPVIRAFKPASTNGSHLILERNPYYFKVDTSGNQLPYIDKVDVDLVQNPEVYTLKASSGEADLALENTTITQMPVFLENAEKGGYRVLEYSAGFTNIANMMLNQTVADPDKRALFQDIRFRKALEIAINRDEINELVFFGLGTPMQNSILPIGGRCWDEAVSKTNTQFDPDGAKALLDEIGMKMDGDWRTLPNGKPFKFTLTYWPGEGGDAKRKIVQLTQTYFRNIGLNFDVREGRAQPLFRVHHLQPARYGPVARRQAPPIRSGSRAPRSSRCASATAPSPRSGLPGSKPMAKRVKSLPRT